MNNNLPPGLIRRAQFRHLIPFAPNTLQRMMAAGKFPRPVAAASSARLYIYRSEDIEAYLNGKWAAQIAPELLAFPRALPPRR
ncbi:hypothetical protein QTH90_08495 [Variovorax sp. J2P1-59]|uniref:helix-turn-helix transcriptional regulator n=1 Tax=Variovorax flavidus TaxID=3053501 RepID=UPI00257525AB|nr:hypothetical protein [Variovorax sp. J2P1-59]MDM0074417.1 hypothetical protein [Variovorax sp. J2P1-59]